MGGAKSVDWSEVEKALYSIKDYEDLCRRLRGSFAYPFVLATFNFSMPELVNHTQLLLGGDSRGRYTEYEARLVSILAALHQAGVLNLLDLMALKPPFELPNGSGMCYKQGRISAHTDFDPAAGE